MDRQARNCGLPPIQLRLDEKTVRDSTQIYKLNMYVRKTRCSEQMHACSQMKTALAEEAYDRTQKKLSRVR